MAVTRFEISAGDGYSVPAVRVIGGSAGKTLIVTAGVHGDEYVAIQAVKEIIGELEPENLAGNVIFVPIVNRSGFYAGTYLVPEDGKNLNRCFPGKKDGTLTERIAYAIEKELYPEADFILDLHGGSPYETMCPLVFFPTAAGDAIEDAAGNVARQLSLSYMVRSSAADGLYSWAAQRGIPAMLIERGGGGKWSRAEVGECKRNIYEAMAALGICTCAERCETPTEIFDARYETAETKGFWYCMKTAGESFSEGELLGRLADENDASLIEIYAPYDGVVLYHTNSLGVAEGFPLMAYGTKEER